jgi:hypothetical protein
VQARFEAAAAHALASPRFSPTSHRHFLFFTLIQREKFLASRMQRSLQVSGNSMRDYVEESCVGARAPDGIVDSVDSGRAGAGLQQRGYIYDG